MSPVGVYVPASLLSWSWQFQGSWTARRSSGQRVWLGQPSWTATLKTGFSCAFSGRKYDKHRKDGVSFHRFTRNEEFRWRLLGGGTVLRKLSAYEMFWIYSNSIAAWKLRKFVEKYKKVNSGWTINWWGKEAQVAKNKRFPLTCCWVRRLGGAWSYPWKFLSTLSRARNWINMRASSGKLSVTAVNLPAVLRPWANFLHALDIIKQQMQSCLRFLATHSPHWHQNVFPIREAGGDKSGSGSLSFSPDWASATAVSVSSTVDRLYSASCHRFYGEISLLCEAKKIKKGTKSSPDDDEEVSQLSVVIIRRIKWSCKCLFKRRGLKIPNFFEKIENHLFPISSQSISVSMTSQECDSALLPPTFTMNSSKTERRMDFGLVAFFLVKNSSIDCESFILGLSSPLS